MVCKMGYRLNNFTHDVGNTLNYIANNPKKAMAVGFTVGGLLLSLIACSNKNDSKKEPTSTRPAFTQTYTPTPSPTFTLEPTFTITPSYTPTSTATVAYCTLEDFVKDMENIIENLESPLYETEKGMYPDSNDILRLDYNERIINVNPVLLDYIDNCESLVKIDLYLQEIDSKTREPTGALYSIIEEGGRLSIDTGFNSIGYEGSSTDSIFNKGGIGTFYALSAAEQQQELRLEELLDAVIQIQGSQFKIVFNKPEFSPSRTPTPYDIINPTNTPIYQQPTNTLQPQQPTATQQPLPTNTSQPQPTATQQPQPTATNPPPPTATNPPPPTATNPPPPTATHPPPPTATNPPPPTATPPPQPTDDPNT